MEDPLSGDLYSRGKPVAISRLVRFKYPLNWVHETEAGPSSPLEVTDFSAGEYIAIEPVHRGRVHIAVIITVYAEQELLEVHLMHVPPDSRYGPWQRRPWTLWPGPNGHSRVEVIPTSEVLCKVTLCENALDLQSLSTLACLGIDVGRLPRRDHSLPPVRW